MIVGPSILIHTPFFHPSVGGMQTFTDGMAGELTRREFRVRVVSETPLGTNPELDRPYEIIRPPYGRDNVLAGSDVLLAVGPSVKLLRKARRGGIPTILRHAAPAGVCPIGIGWRNGKSCDYQVLKCLGCHVSNQSTAANIRSIARFHVLRREMDRAECNIYISHYMAGRMRSNPGTVIWNYFDENRFSLDPEAEHVPVFTYVGRLVGVKGVDVAIRGFAAARRRGLTHKLQIIGEGPDEPLLRELASAEGVAEVVEFRKFQKGEQLADTYRRSCAVLFPSQWEEPFGFVMVEAMACGCPVIASDHGACPEVVGKGGLLVRHDDVDGWARAMLHIASDDGTRNNLVSAALAEAQRFTLPRIADRYVDVIRTAFESSASAFRRRSLPAVRTGRF